ncbi:biogenesis of lysosome-related organelles complex 1 subunit 1 isoform 2-T2 [Trichechus inunguis]
MLSRLLKEHQAKQNERKELQEKRRREAITAATCLTEALVDHLNVGVAQAYMNQRKLDHEVKTLQVQAAQFAKQTGQWIGMVENFNQALKEIGDVENWARSIELDMRTIATALDCDWCGNLARLGAESQSKRGNCKHCSTRQLPPEEVSRVLGVRVL